MLETSPIEAYKAKVEAAKKQLTTLGYAKVKSIILSHYPQYDTAEGGELIKAVWNKRKADYNLTVIIEQVAAGKLKAKKVTLKKLNP